MFREKHEFSGVAFIAQTVRSTRDALPLLPTRQCSPPEESSLPGDDLEVSHCYYHTPERFPAVGETEPPRVRWAGRECYKYNLYMLGVPLGRQFLVVVALPFRRLGLPVFEHLDASLREKDGQFARIRLDRFVEKVQDGRHEGGNVKVASLRMVVHGDAAVDNIALKGTDPIHTQTYKAVVRSLAGASLSLSTDRCKAVYDDHEVPPFWLVTDRYGNYAFRVGANLRNLASGARFFSYLDREELIELTRTFPASRGESLNEGSSAD